MSSEKDLGTLALSLFLLRVLLVVLGLVLLVLCCQLLGLRVRAPVSRCEEVCRALCLCVKEPCLFDSPPKPDALLILVPPVLVLLTSPALLLTVTVLVLLTSPALLLTPERCPAAAAVPPPSESATSPAKSALISP